MFRSLRISHVEFDFQPRPEELGPRRNGRFFRFSGILGQPCEIHPNFGMKFRKTSVPFAPKPRISGIFGRMESALNWTGLVKHRPAKHGPIKITNL